MPPKHKAGRQPKAKDAEDEPSSEREQMLEEQIKALKKELSRKDGIHQDELRAAETALDAQSQKHYFEVLDQRDQLQRHVTDLQARLDEQKDVFIGNAQHRPETRPPPLSTISALQGLPQKNRVQQLIDQHTRRKEKLQAEFDEMTQAIDNICAENDTKRRLISNIEAEACLARDQSGIDPFERVSTSQNTPSNISSNQTMPDLPEPTVLSSATAYPSLPGKAQATHMGGNHMLAHTSYSKVGNRSSQIFTFVNTHVENRDRRPAHKSVIDSHNNNNNNNGEL